LSKKRQIKVRPPNNQALAAQHFVRRIHSQRHPRAGLSLARATTNPAFFPQIVAHLLQNPTYRSIIVPTAFPSAVGELRKLQNPQKLTALSLEGELYWSASILANFSQPIRGYVALRDHFYDAFLHGRYAAAEQCIEGIEKEFGQSIWLFDQKIKLLQMSKGLKAQKDFLGEIINTNGLSILAAWLTYYASLRAENNVSYEDLHLQVSDVLTLPGVGDYVRAHVLPFDMAHVESLEAVLSLEEPHPIIDRWEAFVNVLVLAFSRGLMPQTPAFQGLLKDLSGLGDPRLSNIATILAGDPMAHSREPLEAADLYTIGNYQGAISRGRDQLELCARALAHEAPQGADIGEASIRDEIVGLMHNVLRLKQDAQQSLLQLKKLSHFCAGHNYSTQIIGFVARSHDHVFVSTFSERDKMVALSGSIWNPWGAPVIDSIKAGGSWLDKMSKLSPASPAIELRQALLRRSTSHLDEIADRIPSYRYDMYAGHVNFLNKCYDEAASKYERAATTTIPYVSYMAKRYLYDALFAQGKFEECLSLVVPDLLRNPSVAAVYPIGDLAASCLKMQELRSSMTLAVLLHMAARYGAPHWERDLSDVFENVLSDRGASLPSEIPLSDLQDNSVAIYFLRHVCVPRILSDSTVFESVDAIDAERMAVCQKLLSIDPANDHYYLAEIRSITRDSKVAHLLTKIQTSKIYVDEAGIRQMLEPSMSGMLARFHEMLDSPDLAYQAEKVSKRLEEMLSHVANKEFKGLSLPATELEGLFDNMSRAVLEAFSLNPAYGLDTHLSTSIRHGAFEGELRSPLAREDLLLVRDGKSGWRQSPWCELLLDITSDDANYIAKQLARFTEKFEDQISGYLKEKLHIRVVGGKPGAMFDFDAKRPVRAELQSQITKSTDYETFVDKMLGHAWSLTNASLDAIRNDLYGPFTSTMAGAFDSLVRGVEQRLGHDRAAPILDAIARARTALHFSTHAVADWFQRPTDLAREPFDLETAVLVSLQQINNCYVTTPLNPDLNIGLQDKFEGSMLDGICEILFILMQNVIIHSGLQGAGSRVALSAEMVDVNLVICCRNMLSDSIDIDERREAVAVAAAKYERDSALRLARKEGGSGLSKVWRIAEYDLRVRHGLQLSVSDERWLIARLTLENFGGKLCSSTS
jgi:tetratricopeptide (TPR) repeat protein